MSGFAFAFGAPYPGRVDFHDDLLTILTPWVDDDAVIMWEWDADTTFNRAESFVYLSTVGHRRVGTDQIDRIDQGSDTWLPSAWGHRIVTVQARCESLNQEHTYNAQRLELALSLPKVVDELRAQNISVVRTNPINYLTMYMDGRAKRAAILDFEVGVVVNLATPVGSERGKLEGAEGTATVDSTVSVNFDA